VIDKSLEVMGDLEKV